MATIGLSGVESQAVDTQGTAMTLVYDGADGFKGQGPLPVALKKDDVVHVIIVGEVPSGVAAGAAEDGWTMMKRLQGCITDTPPGEPIGRDHDKHLYGR